MSNLQGQQHASAFGYGVFAFMAKHGEAVGIKHFRDTLLAKGSSQMQEMSPQCFAVPYTGPDDFTSMVIDS